LFLQADIGGKIRHRGTTCSSCRDNTAKD